MPRRQPTSPRFERSELLRRLRGGLVVSCQALPDEPLHGSHHMVAMADAALRGGAVGIRANGVADVAAISERFPVPLIGLWKSGDAEVYITPTARHALAVAYAGADIVAVDATARPRPDGCAFADTVAALREYTGALVLADVSTVDEGVHAVHDGADLVSTTLSGYTAHSPSADGPDVALVEGLARRLPVPVLAEGRIATPEQAVRVLDAGAFAVCVGSMITRPQLITAAFTTALSCRSLTGRPDGARRA